MNVDSTHWPYRSALIIVAHPDDEVLWAGGTIFMHPETRWTVIALCRRNDPDRAPKFKKAMNIMGASGALGDLDDGPEQTPLPTADVQAAALALAGTDTQDLILTHSVSGEYTRHRRHEEVGEAVLALWDTGRLHSHELWAFAYRDTEPDHVIHAIKEADVVEMLTDEVWKRKYDLITEVYGFAPDSFEVNATLREEAFWKLRFSSRRVADESAASL